MSFKELCKQEVYLRQASNAGHLELVFASLDVLSSTGWRINRQVFDVVLEVWNSAAGDVQVYENSTVIQVNFSEPLTLQPAMGQRITSIS